MQNTIPVSRAGGIATALLAVLLAGCGLAETSATAVTEAKAAAEQAKQGKELEEKVQREIAAAQKAEREMRDKAEHAAEQ